MKKVGIMVTIIALSVFILSAASCGSTPPPAPPPAPPAPPPQVAGPILVAQYTPAYFTPDGDGIDDEVTITIDCGSVSPVKNWKLEIREPSPSQRVFAEMSGNGEPPATVKWDGKSASGEVVQSAMEYPFTLTVTNESAPSTVRGTIETGLLVISEGKNLKIVVPSIAFSPNTGGFAGLTDEIVGGNDAVLKRIAKVLNKVDASKITVEGHANVTTPAGASRTREEAQELKPLSEERAKFVMDYLINLGVDKNRLSYIGVGGTRPVVPYADTDNWWKNRRVEFILVK